MFLFFHKISKNKFVAFPNENPFKVYLKLQASDDDDDDDDYSPHFLSSHLWVSTIETPAPALSRTRTTHACTSNKSQRIGRRIKIYNFSRSHYLIVLKLELFMIFLIAEIRSARATEHRTLRMANSCNQRIVRWYKIDKFIRASNARLYKIRSPREFSSQSVCIFHTIILYIIVWAKNANQTKKMKNTQEILFLSSCASWTTAKTANAKTNRKYSQIYRRYKCFDTWTRYRYISYLA